MTYFSGGAAQQIRVEPDPEKLSLYGVTLQQLVAKVKDANRSFLAGQVRDAGIVRNVAAGQTLSGIPDIGLLLVSTRDARPVYVKDVASVIVGPSTNKQQNKNNNHNTNRPTSDCGIFGRRGFLRRPSFW